MWRQAEFDVGRNDVMQGNSVEQILNIKTHKTCVEVPVVRQLV